MDNSPMPSAAITELLHLVINKLTHIESELEKAKSRIDLQQKEINSRIRIPCPAEGCLKSFHTNGHRNRHIRSSVKKGPEREPRWKEHEDAREKLGLALKEDTDNESDREDDILREPQTDPAIPASAATAATAFEDYPATMEVRTGPVPEYLPTSSLSQFFFPGLEPMNQHSDEFPPLDLPSLTNQLQDVAPDDAMVAYVFNHGPEILDYEAPAGNAIPTNFDCDTDMFDDSWERMFGLNENEEDRAGS